MNKSFGTEQEKNYRVYSNLYKAFRTCKDFYKIKNDFITSLLNLDLIPFEDVLISGSGDSDLIFRALEKCNYIYAQGKNFLCSKEFESYSNEEKITILLHQPDEWLRDLNEKEYLNLVKDWPPILKAVEFCCIFNNPEYPLDLSMADLKTMEINKWPDEMKWRVAKSLAQNNRNNSLSDINNADELEKNETFIASSIELKYLFIKKLAYNKARQLIQKKDNYQESDVRDLLDVFNIAKKNLDFRFLSVLSDDIYNSYGVNRDIDFDNEIIKFYNENCENGIEFNSLKAMSSYGKLSAESKLRCLQLCEVNQAVIQEFDVILPEIDLNDFATKEYFLPLFFKKLDEYIPTMLTPAFIAKSSNWPLEIKRCAFQVLSHFFRTPKNFKAVFLPEEIKYLASQNYDQVHIRQKIKDYIYALKPDFEFDEENMSEFDKLLEKMSCVVLDKIEESISEIHKTLENLTIEQLKIYIKKIKTKLQNDESKARDFMDYLFGNKRKEVLYFSGDNVCVRRFIWYIHDFLIPFKENVSMMSEVNSTSASWTFGWLCLAVSVGAPTFELYCGHVFESILDDNGFDGAFWELLVMQDLNLLEW